MNTHSLFITFLVGSLTGIKIDANDRARVNAGFDGATFGSDASSRKHPQPIGEAEAIEGARNRAAAAEASNQGLRGRKVAVGIESSCLISWTHDGETRFADRAYFAIRLPNGQEIIGRSEDLLVPPNVGEQVLACKERTLTIGQALVLEHPDKEIDHQDPHAFLTEGRKSREDFLAEGLTKLFCLHKEEILAGSAELELDLTDGHEPFHIAEVDGGMVKLPVRRTKTGLPIAFFDLLSAEALALDVDERLAKRLAAKIRTNGKRTVVAAPEGKGLNGARFFARELGVPLVVLRKKDRDVNPAIDREAYGSVTTDGGQSLHLTPDHAKILAQAELVAFMDDVASTGGTVKACVAIIKRNAPGAEIVLTAIFQEGTPFPDTYRVEDLVCLGKLPFPVPADKIRYR